MKQKILKGLLVVSALAVAGSALAAPDSTEYFYIAKLEASSSSSDGYRIYPGSAYALPTSQGCPNSDFAEMDGLTMDHQENALLSNTVLAAFMSHRKVQLRLDGCGVTGRPRYRIVRVDVSQ